jgi:hypothetical protein
MQQQINSNQIQREARVFTKPCQGLCDKFDDGICNGWCFLGKEERSTLLKSMIRENKQEAEQQAPGLIM